MSALYVECCAGRVWALSTGALGWRQSPWDAENESRDRLKMTCEDCGVNFAAQAAKIDPVLQRLIVAGLSAVPLKTLAVGYARFSGRA